MRYSPLRIGLAVAVVLLLVVVASRAGAEEPAPDRGLSLGARPSFVVPFGSADWRVMSNEVAAGAGVEVDARYRVSRALSAGVAFEADRLGAPGDLHEARWYAIDRVSTSYRPSLFVQLESPGGVGPYARGGVGYRMLVFHDDVRDTFPTNPGSWSSTTFFDGVEGLVELGIGVRVGRLRVQPGVSLAAGSLWERDPRDRRGATGIAAFLGAGVRLAFDLTGVPPSSRASTTARR